VKNIKSIEEFLNEALRDNWKETVKNSMWDSKEHEFFGKPYSTNLYYDLYNETIRYMMTGVEGDWLDHQKESFYDSFNYNDLDEDEFWEDENNGLKFYNYIKDEIEYLLGELYTFLEDNKGEETLDIYREIDVNQIWLDLFMNKENDEVHLGEYWAYDKDVAEAHGGLGRKHKIKFHARVNQTDVNWLVTFRQNVVFQYEKEINLYPNTPLELIGIEIDREEVDLSNFKNKEIYA
jgi:hypothetical protein